MVTRPSADRARRWLTSLIHPVILLLQHAATVYDHSDLSGPVNSYIFVAVLYFPVFRLWSCTFIYYCSPLRLFVYS